MKNSLSQKLLATILSAALLLNSSAVVFATDEGISGADGTPIVTASETAATTEETPSADETTTNETTLPAEDATTESNEQGDLSDPEGSDSVLPGEDANESDCTCNPAIGTSSVEGHGKDCPLYVAPEQGDCTCPPVDSGEVTHSEGCPLYETPNVPEQSEAVKAVLALLDALPTMDELVEVDTEVPKFAEYLAQLRLDTAAARAAYDALTEEEKAALDADALAKLTALEEVLARMPMLMTANTVTTWAELTAAINAAPTTGTETTITINGTIDTSTITNVITLSAGKNIVINGGKIEGIGKLLFQLTADSKLTLQNFHVDGKKTEDDVTDSYIISNAGTLIISDGCIFENINLPTTSVREGIIENLSSGECMVTGGIFRNNTSISNAEPGYSCVAIYSLGTVTITGGTFSNNRHTGTGFGAALYNASSAKCYITGGTFDSSNVAESNKAGIFHSSQNQDATGEMHLSGDPAINCPLFLDAGNADKFIFLDGALTGNVTLKPAKYEEGYVLVKAADGHTLTNDDYLNIKLLQPASGTWYTKLSADGQSIVATEAAGERLATVYLAPVDGDDINDGKTAATAIKTFNKAKQLLANGGKIILVPPVTISTDELWELPDGVFGGATVTDDGKVTITVGNGGSLNLGDVTIDGIDRIEVESGGSVTLGDATVIKPEAGGTTDIVVGSGGTLNIGKDTSLDGIDKIYTTGGGTVNDNGNTAAGGKTDSTTTPPSVTPPPAVECTCVLSAPTFAGGTIEIPHDAENATQTLTASGSALTGSCQVAGHSNATVTYSFAEKTDTSNIATVSGSTLTVTGAGSVVITATATANSKTATKDATFTVTKEATPAGTPLTADVTKLEIGKTYTIADAAQLDKLSALVKAKQTGFGATIKLLNDVTASDNFAPIGTDLHFYFAGTFDGGGHVVTLNLTGTTADYQGLFGYINTSGTVKNVGVAGTVSGKDYVGGVVGENGGTMQNCSNSATVSGNAYVGGVVGNSSSSGTVQNCYNTGTVTGTGDYVGGVVGENGGTMQNCSNSATVSGTNKVGGVVGGNSSSSGKVQNCYNTGAVSGTKQVGGVVGANYSGTVKNCYNTGTVTGTGIYVGGVVGYNSSATVQNCYNTGAVSGTNQVGGVVGNNSDTVQNCVSLGASVKRTSGTGTDFGRVVGKNSDTLTGNKARSDMLVNGATVTSADATSINGADVTVGDSTTQAGVFDSTAFSDANGWDTISGNLTAGATLPTLTGFTAAQNPTLPEGEAVTPTGHVCNNITFDKSVPTSGDTFPAGNYFLGGDVTASANLLVANGTTVNLCLNGHKLTASNPNEGGGNYSSITVQPNGTLNIYDCSAGNTGKITGGSARKGGCIYNEGTLNLHGGTITGNTAASFGGGVFSEGKVTLYGNASITGNTKNGTSSNLYHDVYRTIEVGSKLTSTIGISPFSLPDANSSTTIAKAAAGYTLTEDDASCFVSDVPGYTIKLDGTNVVMEKIVPQASWVVTGGATGQGTLTEALAAVKASGGTVTLLTDVRDNKNVLTVEIRDLTNPATLVLNGKTIYGEMDFLSNTGLFTIDGTAANSKIQGVGGLAILSDSHLNLNLKGGTYIGAFDESGETSEVAPAIMVQVAANNPAELAKLKTLLADGYKFESEDGFKLESGEATFALTGNTVNVVPDADSTGTPLESNVTKLESGKTYTIANAAQLDKLSALVKNGGQSGTGATINLLNNITASVGFVPIGTFSNDFEGTFDGGSHVVTLNLTNASTDNQGLFGYVGERGTVKNVGVAGKVSGKNNVGGVVGENKGTVQSCYNTGTVSGTGISVGGVVGYNDRTTGTVQSCYNTGTVNSTGSSVGGVVGENFNRGTVTNCYNTGEVSGTSTNVGGVVGKNRRSTVQNCYNTGTVTGTGTGTVNGNGSYVGGVVGDNEGTVQSCYNTGAVSGKQNVGGVVGYNDSIAGTVQNCYNIGTVSGTGNSVGGVVGSNNGTVKSCVSLGASVTGTGHYFGRVVGSNYGTTLADNKARADMLVNGATVTGTATDQNGADVTVGGSTTQAGVFDSTAFSGTNGWNTISGNLTAGATLPTLTGFTAAQNPTLPSAVAVASAITIKINGNATTYGGESLKAAVAASGVTANTITTLTVTAGTVTETDWKALKTTLPALKTLEIDKAVETVAHIPAGQLSSPIFPQSLISVTIPQAITVGEYAFSNLRTSLTTVNLSGATKIDYRAFYECDNLAAVTLNSVTEIAGEAFYGCETLKTITLPKADKIGFSAFYDCTALSSVALPVVTSIGNDAFQNCTVLATMKLPAKPPTVVSDPFSYCAADRSIAFVNANGNQLAGAALTNAQAAYDDITTDRNKKDDGLWYGWKVRGSSVTVPVTGVSLNKTTLSLEAGKNETLTATIIPANATNKAVTWASSAADVATVDESGKVTAVKPGSATITVTTADGGKTATCAVTVTAKVTKPAPGGKLEAPLTQDKVDGVFGPGNATLDNTQSPPKITIDNSITPEKPIEIETDVTIDLGGNTITGKPGQPGLVVGDGDKVTIGGGGTISGGDNTSGAGGNGITGGNGSDITISGGVTVEGGNGTSGGSGITSGGNVTVDGTVSGGNGSDGKGGAGVDASGDVTVKPDGNVNGGNGTNGGNGVTGGGNVSVDGSVSGGSGSSGNGGAGVDTSGGSGNIIIKPDGSTSGGNSTGGNGNGGNGTTSGGNTTVSGDVTGGNGSGSGSGGSGAESTGNGSIEVGNGGSATGGAGGNTGSGTGGSGGNGTTTGSGSTDINAGGSASGGNGGTGSTGGNGGNGSVSTGGGNITNGGSTTGGNGGSGATGGNGGNGTTTGGSTTVNGGGSSTGGTGGSGSTAGGMGGNGTSSGSTTVDGGATGGAGGSGATGSNGNGGNGGNGANQGNGTVGGNGTATGGNGGSGAGTGTGGNGGSGVGGGATPGDNLIVKNGISAKVEVVGDAKTEVKLPDPAKTVDAVLTDVEKSDPDITNVKVTLKVDDKTANKPADAGKVEDAKPANSVIGAFFDITLLKTITKNGTEQAPEAVTNVPNGVVTITIEIPAGMRDGVEDSYVVIRVHNGTAQTLVTIQSGNELTFETDKFSTYAIAYTKSVTPPTPPTPDRDNSGGGSSSDNGEYDFWMTVKEKIQKADSGDVIKVNAKGYDKMPWSVMDTLRKNDGVSLVITWNGKTITIPAGKAQKNEPGRIYWPLSKLAELYEGLTQDSVIVPTNPETGGSGKYIPVTGGGELITLEAPTPAMENALPGSAENTQAITPTQPKAITPPDAGFEKDAFVGTPDNPQQATGNNTFAVIALMLAAVAVGSGVWFWKKRQGAQ